MYFSEIAFPFSDRKIHWPTFVSRFSAVYRVSIPGGNPRPLILLFQASRLWQFLHIAFVRDVTETMGRWLIVNHKHDDYASTALSFVNARNTTRLLGGDKKRNTNIKIHVQVHFIVASRFYVNIIFSCQTESSIPRAS